MIPGSDTTTVAQAAGSGGPPQRQSCDRCHRQKLRCIRNKENSDVCDRCISKRAQCVFSSSLPKGRPSTNSRSVRRLTTDGKNTSGAGNKSRKDENARVPDDASPILTSNSTTSSEATAPTTLPQLMDTSMDTSMEMNLSTWPWMGTTSWEETQPGMSWDGLNFSCSEVDDLLAHGNALDGDTSAGEDFNLFSPNHSPSTPSPRSLSGHSLGLAGLGNYERQDGGNSLGGIFPDKSASVVIGQLSQLSVYLSNLRASSHALAQTAESSFRTGPNEGQFPLIDSATFESVAAWLAYEEGAATLDPHGSVHFPFDSPHMGTAGGQNILRNVFSGSRRLMDITRGLQVDDITRHLVTACEALLLEIYAAILTALQHEAYASDPMSATALGNVRLVLVVQLCGYLIERQHQAVVQCLSPASARKHSLASPVPLGSTETDCLKDLKAQVQQKLARLRQLLRCS